MRRSTGLAAALLVAALPMVGRAEPASAGPVAADSSTLQVGDAAESWYTSLPIDTCSSPVGCPALPSPTAQAYPANTVHISESAGQAIDSLYIQPDLATLASDVTPVAGKVTLPLDSDASSGTASSASATIEACLVTSPFPDGAAGSTDAPPPTDCRVSAPVTAGTTSFGFDLTPFLEAWNRGLPEYGIGLLPTVSSSDPAATWHVALNGRGLPGAPHITSTLVLPATTDAVPTSTGPTATIPSSPTSVAPAPTSLAPGLQPAPITIPSTRASRAAAARTIGPALAAPLTPTTVASASIQAQPAAEVSRTHGFQYPEVLLLPLLFVAGLVFVIRLLTSDATPKRPRKLA